MPQTDPILPGQSKSQDNVMMMEPVRIESSVPVVPRITRWPNPSMVLGRIGQARRSDRTRPAARPLLAELAGRYCGAIPASLAVLIHFAVSARKNEVNSV